MNGQRQSNVNSPVNIFSLSGLLTILVALGIIFIGVREFLYPSVGSRGFGVPLLDPSDRDLLAIKACRDVDTGILALVFLGVRERRFLAYTMAILTLIPVLDGLIVLRHNAWTFTPVILIHWGTAALMIVIVMLLRNGK